MKAKILISGGGIGGCALAHFLRERGFDPVVVESAPEFKHVGYLLALNQQIGQKVAEKMDLLEELQRFEVPLTRSTLMDKYGTVLTSFQVDHATHNKRVGLMLNRADLHEALYRKVEGLVDFRFGDSVAAISDSGKSVAVNFASGREENFDLVIGVDGVHSQTRKLVFGEGFEQPLGQAYFAFTTSNRLGEPVAQADEAVAVRAEGFTLAYHGLRGDTVGGYVFHNEGPGESLAPQARRAFMLERYAPASPTFRRVLEGMSDADPIFHDGFIQIVMPQWHRGRVCLVGDAASCPTPASGVGASLAMAGAYVLAKYLDERDSHEVAFAEYEAYLRPTVVKAHAMARRQAGLASGKNFISYGFTNFVLSLVPPLLIARLHTHEVDMPLP